MNTRPVRVAVIGVAAVLLLGGCGADESSPDAASSSPAAASPVPDGGAGQAASASKQAGDRAAEPGADASPSPDPDSPDTDSPGPDSPEPDSPDGDSGTTGTDDGSAPALEVPEAPEPTVSSLAELVPQSNPAPLVTTPLPRAASAQGRLLRQFPAALRPTRAAQVQSSSVSPSGDRLQVALVATTSASSAQVLLAYRTRLARQGMAETATPPSVAGSSAAAFRRGDSVVTVTVTPRGTGTSYAVHASLRAERG